MRRECEFRVRAASDLAVGIEVENFGTQVAEMDGQVIVVGVHL